MRVMAETWWWSFDGSSWCVFLFPCKDGNVADDNDDDNDNNNDDDNDVDDDIVKDGNGHLMAEVGVGVR